MAANPKTQGAREVFGEVGLEVGTKVITEKGAADLSDRSETHELLTDILVELRFMTRHLASMTGEEFTKEDVDDSN